MLITRVIALGIVLIVCGANYIKKNGEGLLLCVKGALVSCAFRQVCTNWHTRCTMRHILR